MLYRTARLLVVLLGYAVIVNIAGCGYSGTLPAPTGTDVAPPGAIQHVVVIFKENVSFDHYFGTYPQA